MNYRTQNFNASNYLRQRILLFLILFAASIVYTGCRRSQDRHAKTAFEYQVHFVDVGQGDAIFVITPEKNLLIDGGDRSANIAAYIQQENVDHIDFVIATHPHADHIWGLIEVFDHFTIGEVIDPGVVHSTLTYERYLTKIYELDIPYTVGRSGLTRELSKNSFLKVLYPLDVTGMSLNNSSIVAKLTIGEISLLFTGDIEASAEDTLLVLPEKLQSHVLKVAHHGSSTSSQLAFLEAVMPEVSIISCAANNRYGFPHSATLENLNSIKSEIYRTDIHGNIVLLTDGVSYKIEFSTPNGVERINLNTATLDEMMRIQHIDENRAIEIMDMRPLQSVDDLLMINGIGLKRLEDIKNQNLVTID